MLYNKWWSKEQSGAECPRGLMEDISKASALNIVNIGGVFVVLLCGLAVAVLVSLLESLFCFRKTDVQTRQSASQATCSSFLESCSELYRKSSERGLENNLGSCDSCNAVRGEGEGIRYI